MFRKVLFSTFILLSATLIYAADGNDANMTAAEMQEIEDTKSGYTDQVQLSAAQSSPSVWKRYNFNRDLNFYITGNGAIGFPIYDSKDYQFGAGGGFTVGVNFYKYFGFELGYSGYTQIGDWSDTSSIIKFSRQHQIKPSFIFQIPFWPTNALTLTPYIGIGFSGTFIKNYEVTRSLDTYYPYTNMGRYESNRRAGPTEAIISPTAKLGLRLGIYWLLLGVYSEYTYAYTDRDISHVTVNFEIGARF